MERVANVPDHDGTVPRVQGPLEVRWARAGASERAAIAAELLARPNPIVSAVRSSSNVALPGSDYSSPVQAPEALTAPLDPNLPCDYTWIVEAPEATAVLLWANGLFNHLDPSPNEMTHLEGSNLWTLTWRLPASWRASYRISVWTPPSDEGLKPVDERPTPTDPGLTPNNADSTALTPPWRASGDRFAARRAAMAGQLDVRCEKKIGGANGESSLAEGPLAPLGQLATAGHATHPSSSSIRKLIYPASDRWLSQRVWLYSPNAAPAPTTTPLLVLFDGQTWLNSMDLPSILDSMILSGHLPPLHVAMIDSRDTDTRWEQLGVPSGQAEFVARHLVTDLQDRFPITADASKIIVSGQSLGGIGALWAADLAEGRIGRVIAQSPSLWRFDMVEPLIAGPGGTTQPPARVARSTWQEIVLQAGHFEGQMLSDAESLAKTLQSHPDLAGSHIRVDDVWGGHDWAWWRVSLFDALSEMLSPDA